MRNKLDVLISKLAHKKLKMDPISGIKGRFRYNIEGMRVEVDFLVNEIALENGILVEYITDDEILIIEKEFWELYGEL